MQQAVDGLLTALDRDTEPPASPLAPGYGADSLLSLGRLQAHAYHGRDVGLAEALAELKACRDAVFSLLEERLADLEVRGRARLYVQGYFDCTEIALAQCWVALSVGESAAHRAPAAHVRPEAA